MRRIFAVLVATAGAASAGGTGDAEFTTSARDWLSLVDAARYEQAWSRTAPSLRDGSDRERWAAQVRAARRNDGATTCRKAIALDRPDHPPRVVVLFVSEFADGHRIGEKVTLSADGTQVLDYRVGPAATDRGAPCATSMTPEPLQ